MSLTTGFDEWKANSSKGSITAGFEAWKNPQSKPSTLSKVGGFAKDVAIDIGKTITYTPQRLAQAALAISGATPEEQNIKTQNVLGPLAMPVPTKLTPKGVVKEAGRALQLPALGLPVSTIPQALKAGGAFALGQGMEQGDLLTKKGLETAAATTAFTAAIPIVGKQVGKLFRKGAKEVSPVAPEVPTAIPEVPPTVSPVARVLGRGEVPLVEPGTIKDIGTTGTKPGAPVVKPPYYEWLKTNPAAIKMAKELSDKAKSIPDKKNRASFLKESKQKFETKFTNEYSKIKEPTQEEARAAFKESWSKAYGNRPATIESPSALQQRSAGITPSVAKGAPLNPVSTTVEKSVPEGTMPSGETVPPVADTPEMARVRTNATEEINRARPESTPFEKQTNKEQVDVAMSDLNRIEDVVFNNADPLKGSNRNAYLSVLKQQASEAVRNGDSTLARKIIDSGITKDVSGNLAQGLQSSQLVGRDNVINILERFKKEMVDKLPDFTKGTRKQELAKIKAELTQLHEKIPSGAISKDDLKSIVKSIICE